MKISKSLSSSARVLRPLRRRPFFWIGLLCVLLTVALEVDCVTYRSANACVAKGNYSYVTIRRADGVLVLYALMGSLSNVSGPAHWVRKREASPEPLSRLFARWSYCRESMFQYTKDPKTGWNSFLLYVTIPGWLPFIATGTGWGVWILIAMLRRQKAIARLSFDQGGIAPSGEEVVEPSSGVAP